MPGSGSAPVLHGLGVGLISLVVWFGVNLFFGEPTDQTAQTALGAEGVLGLLVLRATAAIVGAR